MDRPEAGGVALKAAEHREVARGGHGAILGALALAFACVARALVLALSQRVALFEVLGEWLRVLWFLLFVAGTLVAFAFQRARSGARAAAGLAGALRALFVVAVLGWLAFLAFAQPFQRLWFDLWLGLLAGGWALALFLRERAAERTPRLARVLGMTAFGLCAAVLGLELGLRAWAALAPAPWNVRVGSGPSEWIRRFRCEPGLVRFGFACNRLGYYDEEFTPSSPGDGRRTIAAIGDSFHVGMVPHAWHFTTLVEERLGVRVHNFGVPGIGPAEYLWLLVEEALPLDPDEIVVGLFVGNDLGVPRVQTELPDAGLRAWFQRDQVLSVVVPARLTRELEERRAAPPASGASAPGVFGREAAARLFPWLADPSLEEPTYSEETFLEIETSRALEVCVGTPPGFEELQRALLAARQAAGAIPLRVLLIPDEFQVEDALWAEVLVRAARPLDRTAPQRRLRAWLEAEQIPFLDLLPALLAVQPGPDGRRHLYHRQDTHFNARGNQVAAEALAAFLR